MYSAIVLAGGSGTRMKNNIPKQYMLLAGKPIIMHTLERLDMIDSIEEIIVVCANEYAQQIRFMATQYGIKKPLKLASAGQTRQESVLSGLGMVTSEKVLIHEAARPFVKKSEFEELIAHPGENVVFGSPINYTVLRGSDKVEAILNRSELINVQLPQKFNTALLVEAHRKARLEGRTFTEDASVLFYYNRDIAVDIMSGSDYNIKITTPTDMLVGKIIYDEYFSGRAD